MGFFLLAVRESARKTLGKIQRLRALDQEFRQRLAKFRSQLPVQLLDRLQAFPFITVPIAQAALDVKTSNSAKGAIDKLLEAGILEEISWKPRGLRGRPPSVFRCTEIARLVGE